VLHGHDRTTLESSTLAGKLESWAGRQPDAPAVMHHDDLITYKGLRDRAVGVAKGLLRIGVRRGDVVAALFGNEPDWLAACFGSAYVGATFVPLNTWHKSQELAWTLRHCEASVLLTMTRFMGKDYTKTLGDAIARAVTSSEPRREHDELPRLRHVVARGGGIPGAVQWQDFIDAGTPVPEAELAEALASVKPTDVAFVLYTSGSTSTPKGVQLLHGPLLKNGSQIGARRGIREADRVWLGSPLFYALGAANAMPAVLTRGAALVIQDYFDAGRAIETMSTWKATVYYGTGNMTQAILDDPSYSHTRLASLVKGHAGTTTAYKRLTLLEMGITHATGGYGLTECYGHSTGHRLDDPVDVKLQTNGTPLPGTEIIIVDPDSREPLAPGGIGRVLIRGFTTPGYLKDPSESAKALLKGGFFDTGDLGELDAAGRFIFHARLKEVIKAGGISVSPPEVEQLLCEHPAVHDAHVVGVPDDVHGETIVAFVELRGEATEAELRQFVRSKAASFKVPSRVFVRQAVEIPRLGSGKVARLQLREEGIALLANDNPNGQRH
jgi:fatty-acyl-CoA synthase